MLSSFGGPFSNGYYQHRLPVHVRGRDYLLFRARELPQEGE
jgi:hypothetical protein